MPTNHDHGVLTGVDDQIFHKKGQAVKAAADFITSAFDGGQVTRVERSEDQRTVVHRGIDATGKPVTVTVREDTDNPSTIVPDLAGSIDLSSKKLSPRGRSVTTRTHYGFEKE